MLEIQPPTHCPNCNSELEWSNQLLYCRNASCGAQASKRVEHFAKTMKIKGLGPAAVSKLNLTEIRDIFRLTVDEIAAGLNSEALASKLFLEVEKAKQAPANLVLPALGIPLIGKTATAKLSTVVDSILDIDKDSCTKAGLGPKATENLMTWLDNALQNDFWETLPLNLDFEKTSNTPDTTNGVVCISGKLTSYKNKSEAATALKNAGYEVSSNLTKAVTILVNESGLESAKTKKAKSNGIRIVTNLSEILGEF